MQLQFVLEVTALIGLALMLFGGIALLNFRVVAFGAAATTLCGIALEWPRPQDMTPIQGIAVLVGAFVLLVVANTLATRLAIAVWQRVRGRLFDYRNEPWEPFLAVLPVRTANGWRWMQVVERYRDGHGSSSETADSWWVYRPLV